jgi:ligand-binding SRPBCC domain-containing protein
VPTLFREQFLPRPREEVFAFFTDIRHLGDLTPDFLHFRILTPLPFELKAGACIDYRLRLFGIPFGWTTRIETFEPAVRFSDSQLRGPYRSWLHTHEFSELDGGTLVRDRVDYELPLGPLGRLAQGLWVRRSVERIFDYRREVLEREFGAK